jgi:hypothetical protein
MFNRMPIGRKIAVAITLFTLPVAFILWLLAAGQGKDIEFASREVAGVQALGSLLAAQTVFDAATLGGPPPGSAPANAVTAASPAFARLGLSDQATALLQAWSGPGGNAAAGSKLRDLEAAVGDRSNLILDNVLDTYYTTDVVLNRLTDILDSLAALQPLAAGQAASADAKAAFLIALGGLQSDLDGMDSSMQAAEKDNLEAPWSQRSGPPTARSSRN